MDKPVRFSCQIFSGFNMPKIIIGMYISVSELSVCSEFAARPVYSTCLSIYELTILDCSIITLVLHVNCTRQSIKSNHGLRGSASPVLTATGFVNGRGQFSTPTESTPLDRSPRNLLLVITSATPTAVPNLVQIRPRGASGQMGEI